MIDNRNFIGEKFNDWTIIDWVKGKKGIEWVCQCKCGKIKTQKVDNIKNGRSRMCKECMNKEKRKEKKPKEEKILKLRFNNHLNWTEENTFIGTYREYLKECRKRKENEKIEKKKKQLKEYCEDVLGKRYGKLTVISIGKDKKGTIWKCQCDCGKIYSNYAKYIKYGNIISCGCIAKEIKENAIYDKRIYGIWRGMVDRCYNPNNMNYKNYGGRGINICEEWRNNPREFINWAYKNGYNENAQRGECTIDRIDVNENYEPSNCRWVDMKTQANNKRYELIKRYKIYEEELTTKEIQKKYEISPELFKYRISRGMTNEEAVTKPKRKRK